MMEISGKSAFVVMVVLWSRWDTGHSIPSSTNENGLTLRLLHTNDMHSRFSEISPLLKRCSDKNAAANKCYGGFARIATIVREARNSTTPTIFLNAGDTYQGSVWFNVHKWEIVSEFLNLLSPDAISLGHHEFDNGIDGLVPFINAAKFPIVAANLNLTGEPKMAASNLKNHTILTVNGTKIGVIGYLTPETKVISLAGNVGFLNEVESIRREVSILRENGVKILIAVGHSGFEVDKIIAAEVDGLDIVIGGRTNTFLYTGEPPNMEAPEGPYPTEIVQKNGRKVYVVQAYAYTKYLGNLTVDFDSEGEVTRVAGNPILMNSSIEEAEDVISKLYKLLPKTEAVALTEIGSTKVLLNGNKMSCRTRECNMGNLITDAMVDYNAREYANVKGKGWTDAAIAFFNGGTISSSIVKAQGEKITMGDIIAVLPFKNSLAKMTMNGSTLMEVLEWSVRTLNPNKTAKFNGAFLQFSGVQVIYDLSKPAGSRVYSAHVRCAACTIPSFSKLDKNATYTILTTDFMCTGADGYSMLINHKCTLIGVSTDELLAHYIRERSPVHPDVEGRIRYFPSDGGDEIVSSDPAATPHRSIAAETTITNRTETSGSASYRSIGFVVTFLLMVLRLT